MPNGANTVDKRLPPTIVAMDEQLAKDQRQYNESDAEWRIIERLRASLAKMLDAANLLAVLKPEDDTPHIRKVLQRKYAEADSCRKEAAALAKSAGINFKKFPHAHEFTFNAEAWKRIQEQAKES